jgi:hypothetical protein
MKLSELRPCDKCGGSINPIFHVVRYSPAIVSQQAARETLGLSQMFGGHLGLAEVMTSKPDAVSVAMDDKEHAELGVEIFLCNDCYCGEVNLAALAEKVEKNNKEQVGEDHTR